MMVENHLIIVKKLQLFHQLIVLMWEVSHWVLASKYSVVVELSAFKVESMKRALFSIEKWKLKVWRLVTLESLKIFEPKSYETVSSFR